ncbi:Alpha-xylosidase BoGH31A [Seminavis robusta]|uniref:Alpha-xylosidase BoGH31A n=1 Tax=Seminavis robusta TaxID=568900 RepID=A0A9N8EDW4_9STRA|nr:Alpha-xylosidase BoGH31A [Seminavis robusta]|eukprot:Sro947_g223430.1 Alpha-xylosidase BoGH31A (914) ;mRNA; f:19969-22710
MAFLLKKCFLVILLAPLLLVWGSVNDDNDNVVEVNPHVALEVISPGIIRVFRNNNTASSPTASQALQQRQSLVVVDQPKKKIDFHVDVIDDNTTLLVTTDLLVVQASILSGKIEFRKRKDRTVLLAEDVATLDSKQNTVRQDFWLSSPTEALYGGGQFVNGALNYRSAPIQWVQTNTQAVVPFLLSSRQYGILWDLYGETMMNPPQHQIQMTNDGTNNYTGSFVSPAEGDYWFYIEACAGPYQKCQTRPAPVQLSLWTINDNPRKKRTIVCEHFDLYNLPHSISCRVRGLIQDQQYHVVLQDLAVSDKNIMPAVYYTAVNTHNKLSLETQATNFIDYYFVANGNHHSSNNSEEKKQSITTTTTTLDGVIANYRQLTGTAKLYSRWVYGFWQCKEHYKTQQELLDAATKFRQLRIPVDAIVQDWRYWGDLGWGPHWDPRIYPDPQAMIQQLHNNSMHFMVSVWSRFDTNTKFYKTMNASGLIIENANQYMDAWNPLARNLFFQFSNQAHFSIGADALWLDATEPEGSLQRHKQIHLGTGDEYANTYSLMVSKSIHDGLLAQDPHRRVFSLTRSSFAGQQRYGATLWSGDTSSTWDSLRRQIAMSINYQLSGIPYWSMDTGGFFRPPNQYTDPDYHHLLTRWFQFAVFTPVFRVHGSHSNTELWNYGKELQDVIVHTAIRFRYRLLEYIYSGFDRVEREHYTMQRGLVLDFWYDDTVQSIPDQFMFGDSFLVAPIYTPDSSRTVYLPKLMKGTWRCFWSGKELKDAQTIHIANMTRNGIPLFVRSSILVLGPDGRQHVNDILDGEQSLEVRVYAGTDSQFVLFEDDGISGDPYRPTTTITFRWHDDSSILTIGKRNGTPFPGMAKTRTIHVVLVRPGVGVGIDPSRPDVSLAYNGTSFKVKLQPTKEPLLALELS